MDRHAFSGLWARLVKGVACAAVVFLGLTAVPLGYQFFGPGRIIGPIQPLNDYVTDIVNVVVPNAYTALDPHFALSLSQRWSPYIIENDAYIGLPLIAIGGFAIAWWWRERWVRLVGLGTIAAFIWSLGPYLHFDGVSERAIGLPGAVLVLLPVADNILPARFDLFTDFGFAALIAVFVDRAVLAGSWRARAASGTAMLLVCVTLAPREPIAAYAPGTPRYFVATGEVRSLRQGTSVLVVPYGDSTQTMAPMLWQAVSGFRFRMVAGTMWTAGPRGAASFGGSTGGTSLDCIMEELQFGRPPTDCTAYPLEAARSELDKLRVSAIIMGLLAYGTDPTLMRPMEQFVTAVAGAPPRHDEGVLLWEYP
jgi:dolichyl-phosphate beta-glucosyltransferase